MPTRLNVLRVAGALVVSVLGAVAFARGASSTNQASPAQNPPARPDLFKLVTLQTGQDASCRGGNLHRWPVGISAEDCHGWRAVDPTGRQHNNSANTIQCHADGSFSFRQYAGNIECRGASVRKTYQPDACQQDMPPVLHTKAIDLTCCTRPDSPECKTGLPSVSVPGGEVFHNGRPIAR